MPSLNETITTVCGICHKQVARYTCPACNLRYCSNACYKSEKHASCSEAFYHKSLVAEVQSSNERTNEEKNAMLEILKRLQDEQAEEGNDEERDDDLADKLADVDIDQLDSSSLEALLDQDQLKRFHNMLRDPAKVAELLAEETSAMESPWWELESDSAFVQEKCKDLQDEVPKWRETSISRELVWNALALIMAYTHWRRSNYDVRITDDLKRSVPFLFDRSSILLKSHSEALDYVIGNSGLPLADIPTTRKQVLADTCIIVQPTRIGSADSYFHQNRKMLASLQDIRQHLKGALHKLPLADRKLLYYASFLGSSESADFQRMQSVHTSLLHLITRPVEEFSESGHTPFMGNDIQRPSNLYIQQQPHSSKPRIVELD